MKKKKIILIISIIAVLLLTIGVSLAAYTYTRVGSNQELVLGDIYMHYNEGNGITLTDALPYQIKDIVNPVMQTQEYEEDTRNELSKCVDSVSSWWSFDEGEDPESFCKGTGTNYGDTFQEGIDEEWFYDDDENYYDYGYEFLTSNNIIVSDYYNLPYFEFTISGKNTYTEKDIWYDISLIYGDKNETRNTRIRDNLLKFTLVEIKDGVETTVVDNQSYSSLNNKKIYVNTIEKNTTSEVNITYRLYMWIDYNTVIGNVNQDYTIEEWKDVYASIKVKVTGDFNEKTAILSPILKAEVSSYELASSSDFTGGLVAINTDGELYDETDSQQEIREYRYIGLDVNNYIFLDTNGDNVQDDNEMWRIVGIFKNSNDEWNLKLMRNTVFTSDEIPFIYTYNKKSYNLKPSSTSQYAYRNYKNTATNLNDWTTAKLQYWLNDTTTNGYYGTLSNSIQNIIDTDYTYYLGNNTYSTDTTILSYATERNASNIWSGNSSSWNGSVALLYPSDYGYSANSSYWSGTTLEDYYTSAYSTSWMQQNANHTDHEWFLSPSSYFSSHVALWNPSGLVDNYRADSYQVVRPVLNLISNFGSLLGSGTEFDPYVLS